MIHAVCDFCGKDTDRTYDGTLPVRTVRHVQEPYSF